MPKDEDGDDNDIQEDEAELPSEWQDAGIWPEEKQTTTVNSYTVSICQDWSILMHAHIECLNIENHARYPSPIVHARYQQRQHAPCDYSEPQHTD